MIFDILFSSYSRECLAFLRPFACLPRHVFAIDDGMISPPISCTAHLTVKNLHYEQLTMQC